MGAACFALCDAAARNAKGGGRLFMFGVQDFNYAGLNKESGEIISCQMYLPRRLDGRLLQSAGESLERMILENRAPYPVERTLLTSGMTLSAVDSLHRSGEVVETPEMDVRYTVPKESFFWQD